MASLMRKGDKILGYVVVDKKHSSRLNEYLKLKRILDEVSALSMEVVEQGPDGKSVAKHPSLIQVQVMISHACREIHKELKAKFGDFEKEFGMDYELTRMNNDILKYNEEPTIKGLDMIKNDIKRYEDKVKARQDYN